MKPLINCKVSQTGQNNNIFKNLCLHIQMTEKKGVSRKSSFHSVLTKLAPKEKASAQRTSKWYGFPESTSQSEDGETNQSESNCADGGLESTCRDEVSGTSTQRIDSEEPNSSPTTFPRWERIKLTPDDWTKNLEDLQSSERGNLRETPGLEEEPCAPEPHLKDSSSKEESGSSTHGPKPTPRSRFREEIKKALRTPPPKPRRRNKLNLNLNNEEENGGQEPSNTDGRSCKPVEEPSIRQTRSASDPLRSNTRSEKSLSDPNRHSADMGKGDEVQTAVPQAELMALFSTSKQQKKGKKEQKMKNKRKTQEKGSKHDDEEAQSVSHEVNILYSICYR